MNIRDKKELQINVTTLLSNKETLIDEQLNTTNGSPYATADLTTLGYEPYELNYFKKLLKETGKDKRQVVLNNDVKQDGRVTTVGIPSLRLFATADEPDRILVVVSGKLAQKKTGK